MSTIRPLLLASLLAPAASLALADTTPTEQQQIDQLRQQIQDLQSQLQAVAGAQQPESPKLQALEKIGLWGYGEIYYTRPTRVGRDTRADLARAVFGIGYQFNDSTRFNSEYEVEHAVSSADDSGEFEVEQFYVDHNLSDSAAVESGLFLIPAGFLNESHEPTNFYGVQRNFVETLVIPSTWREGGVALHGDTAAGLRWSAGLTTVQNLAAWNFTPEYPPYGSALELQTSGAAPLQQSHQELQFASAQHLAQYGALNYHGLPGVLLGGSLFTGLASESANPDGNQRITLWEAHGRWSPGRMQLSALYAHGSISNTGGANLRNPGAAAPMPAAFSGGYVEAGYRLWEAGESSLSPFLRAERYNLGERFDGLAPGFAAVPAGAVALADGSTGSWPQLHDRIYTAGANYYLTPNVVFKADYQRFNVNRDFSRVDLGLGLAF